MKPTYEELLKTLKLAESQLEHSEDPHTTCDVYLSPAMKLRDKADKLERQDLAVEEIRDVIERAEKSEKDEGEYSSNGYYSAEKGDPEVHCWHCNKTFLCDCCDATCRLCGAPFDARRCHEFNFIPKGQR